MNTRTARLLRIGRNVADLDRAVAFHRDALGFRAVDVRSDAPPAWTRLPGACDSVPRSQRLRLGRQEIELTAFDPPGAPYPADSTAADLWFQHCAIVVDDMEAACAHLLRHGGASAISRDGPQRLPPSSGGVTAFKFRDPDGHPLELISLPSGSGDPVWQERVSDSATLGIDHSAISVSDVGRSIAFYAGLLGLEQTATQTNGGDAQGNLDGLTDVDVQVVALQPTVAVTPHVELLGYRNPRGRASPGMDITDIAADRLVLQVHGLPALLERVAGERVEPLVAQAVPGNDGSQSALLRDPDGHWIVLVQ